MLKREIERQVSSYEDIINNTFKPQQEHLSLWKRLKKNFNLIQLVTTMFAIITLIFQITLGIPVLHMIFCAILVAAYLFLFILSIRNEKIKSKPHFIPVAVIWLLNMILTIPKVF